MLLHEGLTYIQSQIKPRLLFGESFTLTGKTLKQLHTLAYSQCWEICWPAHTSNLNLKKAVGTEEKLSLYQHVFDVNMVIFKKRYGFPTAGILLKDWEPLEESSQIISTAGTSKVSFRKTFSAQDVPSQGLLLSEHTGGAYWLVKYAQYFISATWQLTQDLLVSLYFYIHCCLSCCFLSKLSVSVKLLSYGCPFLCILSLWWHVRWVPPAGYLNLALR